MRFCSIPGCKNRHNAHGLCATHQRRLRVHCNLDRGRQPKLPPRFCTIPGCDKPLHNRGMCQMHCWRQKHYGDPLREPYQPKLCSVPGCGQKRKGHGLCPLHLCRKKKGLPLGYRKPTLARKRYKTLMRPDHPLADVRGRVAVHRMVLFDRVSGPLPCFWCGGPLEWLKNLFVDHLNHDRHDNRPKNLVPACNGCNAGRTIKNPRIRQSVYSPGKLVMPNAVEGSEKLEPSTVTIECFAGSCI